MADEQPKDSPKQPEQKDRHLKLVKPPVKSDVPPHPSAETTREQAQELEDLHGTRRETRETPSFNTEQTAETLKHHHKSGGK
jgi:hypothetical protein